MRVTVAVMLLLASVRSIEAAAPPTKLTVTPATGVEVTQTVGSSGQPGAFTYRLTSNRGSINWRVGSLPPWLNANLMNGKTAATLLLTVNSALPVGVYATVIPIIASTNTVTLPAKIAVTLPSLPPTLPPTTETVYLVDNAGNQLMTDTGEFLVG